MAVDSTVSPSSNDAPSKEDLVDLLSDDDVAEEPEKKEDKKESKSEDKDIDDDKIELSEDDEPDEDKIELDEEPDEDELIISYSRKEILSKYPKIFKDFPNLEKAVYRNREFSEMFGTPKDAKEVVQKAEILDKFETDLLSGNINKVLETVKTNAPEAFNKIADNYLQTLARVDERAYYHVVGKVVENIVANMISEGQSSKDDTLETAAKIVNRFIFGTTDFRPKGNLSREESKDNTESDTLKQERESFIREKFESARDDLDSKMDNILKGTIDSHIDPKEVMTDYVKRNATREALEDVKSLIGKDREFQAILNKLWERAFSDNFSKQSLERISSAYRSKARTLLPEVIKKSRNEALKGLGREVKSDKDKRGPIPAGRSTSEKRTPNKPGEIPRNMKTLDYLMQDD